MASRPRRFSKGTTRRLSSVGMKMLRAVEKDEDLGEVIERASPPPPASHKTASAPVAQAQKAPVDYFSQALTNRCWSCMQSKPYAYIIIYGFQYRVRQQLYDFYSQRDPSKLGSVDSIMASYAGREHEVIQLLKDAEQREREAQVQAGIQSAAQTQAEYAHATAKTMLVNFYQERDPAKVAGIDKILQQYSGREDEIPAILQRTQVAEKAHAHKQLVEFYTARDPSKLPNVDHIMQQYAGLEWKIPKMLAGQIQAQAQVQAQPEAQVSANTTGPVRRFSNRTARRLSNVGTDMLRKEQSPSAAEQKKAAPRSLGGRKVSRGAIGLFSARERSFSYKSPLGEGANRKTLKPRYL